MPVNGKHTMQNKFKPYEIVIENRDPVLGPNSPDAPAGFSPLQKRKWKLWINPVSGNEFVRKSKYENEWILKSSGGASCPTNIVSYNNHYAVGRTIENTEDTYGRDVTDLIPYLSGGNVVVYFGEYNNIGISSNSFNGFLLQDIVNYFQINYLDGIDPLYVLYIEGNTIKLRWNGVLPPTYPLSDFVFGAFDENSGQWILPNDIDGAYSFINLIPGTEQLGPCELFQLPPSGSNSTYVPTPQIRYLKNDNNVNGIQFEAYFNQADRWILDYEPEIYLYFLKSGGGYKNHTNTSTRKRIAHMAQTDEFGIPSSLKLTINPRLRGESGRLNEHNTEWLVDGTKPDMSTKFIVQPFQFLGRVNNSSTGIGSFPINPAIWNTSGTGTEFPPTLSKRGIGDQDLSPNEDITIACCFKLVIKNPTNTEGFPIESDISEIFKIRPNIKRNESDYGNRKVKLNR